MCQVIWTLNSNLNVHYQYYYEINKCYHKGFWDTKPEAKNCKKHTKKELVVKQS